ncbi:MAG: SIS domain-containing protein [Nocardioides sp.]
MLHVAEEIASQPDCWVEAGRRSRHEGRLLPTSGERVAVVGCGTSWFVGHAYAALREAAGEGLTDAFPASEFPLDRDYDRVVAISRSGTTTEVLAVLDALRNRLPTVAITADPATPVVEHADEVVVLEFADEQAVVQTRFATTTLALLRSHIGEDLTPVIADAWTALDAPLPVEALAREQFTYLGRGWTVGLAHEAALKMREAALAWSESYPAMEYRHGPMSISDERSLVWSLGLAPEGLARDVEGTSALWVESTLEPMAELIRCQRLAVALAVQRGLDPDCPRNLSRSVVLQPGGR